MCFMVNSWSKKGARFFAMIELTAGKASPSADKHNAPNSDINSSRFGMATASKTNANRMEGSEKQLIKAQCNKCAPAKRFITYMWLVPAVCVQRIPKVVSVDYFRPSSPHNRSMWCRWPHNRPIHVWWKYQMPAYLLQAELPCTNESVVEAFSQLEILLEERHFKTPKSHPIVLFGSIWNCINVGLKKI